MEWGEGCEEDAPYFGVGAGQAGRHPPSSANRLGRRRPKYAVSYLRGHEMHRARGPLAPLVKIAEGDGGDGDVEGRRDHRVPGEGEGDFPSGQIAKGPAGRSDKKAGKGAWRRSEIIQTNLGAMRIEHTPEGPALIKVRFGIEIQRAQASPPKKTLRPP